MNGHILWLFIRVLHFDSVEIRKVSMTARISGILCAAAIGALTQISGAATAPFAPLEAWKAAVANGDRAALAKLYSPDAKIYPVRDKPPIALQDEVAFWADMKPHGLTRLNPRLLELTMVQDRAQLRLRVSATSGDVRQYASILQEWAHHADGWKIVTLRRNPFEREPVRTLPQPAAPNVKLYSEPREAEAELKAGLAKAAAEHKRVLVVFGGNWCYDCHVLDTTFHSKDFAPLVNANYVVVHINIGDEGKDNNDLAARLGVALDKGVPSLGVLEPDGKVVYAQKNGEFEATEKIGPEDIRAFLEKWKPRLAS
jgi:ketosteroid isomerase-like protein